MFITSGIKNIKNNTSEISRDAYYGFIRTYLYEIHLKKKKKNEVMMNFILAARNFLHNRCTKHKFD